MTKIRFAPVRCFINFLSMRRVPISISPERFGTPRVLGWFRNLWASVLVCFVLILTGGIAGAQLPPPSIETCFNACRGVFNSCVSGSYPNCTCTHQYTAVDNPGSCGNAAFFTSVWNDGYLIAKATTCDSAVFRAAALSSSQDAVNQVLKFRKRIEFLNLLITDAKNARDTIQKAVDHITAFLDAGTVFDATNPPDAPAERMIALRQALVTATGNSANPALPSTVVYVWQDPALTYVRENGTKEGYYHAVKVEARLPKRCYAACGTDRWPSVKTKTKRWGLTRCYFMVDTDGMVKVRVIRFDEDRDPKGFVFPNGVPIFGKVKLSHPDYTGLPGGGIANPGVYCLNRIHPDLRGAAIGMFGVAFMQNERSVDPSCWDEVHERMLRFGVVTDMCASYFIARGTMGGTSRDSMRMKFVNCDGDFLSGSN